MCKEVAGEKGQVESTGENGGSLEDYKERPGVGEWSSRRRDLENLSVRLGGHQMTFLRTFKVAPVTFPQLTPRSLGLCLSEVLFSFC